MTAEKPEYGTQRQLNAIGSIQMTGNLGKRYIRRCLHQRQDLVAECVDPMGSDVTARSLGSPAAGLPPPSNPFDCRRNTKAKSLRCRPARHPAVYSCDNPFAQIV
jgi:hypothetical protein